MNYEKELIERAIFYFNNHHFPSLSAVFVEWKNNTAIITCVLYDDPVGDELDEISCLNTDIIAGIPEGYMEENFIKLEEKEKIPKSSHLVF